MLKTTILPEIYPDELLYSYIARLGVYWGCRTHQELSEIVLEDKLQFPNLLFINRYNDEFLEAIVPRERKTEFLCRHTLFPYYARFLPQEQRTAAFEALEQLDGKTLMDCLPVPHRGEARFLKYCPMCVEEDRQKNGETYWHRSAQLWGIDICPEHFCHLLDTELLIDSHVSPVFRTAEETVSNEKYEETYCTQMQKRLAKYVNSIFQSSLSDKQTTDIRAYLKSRLACPEYRSPGGEEMKISPFYNDFMKWSEGLDLHGFTEKWMITKTFGAQRKNPFEICLLGLFSGLRADEMTSPGQMDYDTSSAFVKTVRGLCDEGYRGEMNIK